MKPKLITLSLTLLTSAFMGCLEADDSGGRVESSIGGADAIGDKTSPREVNDSSILNDQGALDRALPSQDQVVTDSDLNDSDLNDSDLNDSDLNDSDLNDSDLNDSDLPTDMTLLIQDQEPPLPEPSEIERTWRGVHAYIITPYCQSCHNANSRSAGLSLEFDQYESIVLQESWSLSNLIYLLVRPGVPEESYLWMKMSGAPGATGSRMPVGGPIDPGYEEAVREWIELGAPP